MSTNFHLLNPWFSPEETTSLCSPVVQYESYSNIPCLLRAGSWEYESFSIFNAPFRVFLLYSMKLMLTCFTFSILHPCSLYYLTLEDLTMALHCLSGYDLQVVQFSLYSVRPSNGSSAQARDVSMLLEFFMFLITSLGWSLKTKPNQPTNKQKQGRHRFCLHIHFVLFQ